MIREWRALARLLPMQECWLCHGSSHGKLLCGFCRRALPRCADDLPRADLARAAGLDSLAVRHEYRFPLDVLIGAYKYQGELALAPVLAALLPPPGQAATGGALARTCPEVLGVPASDARVRSRGFDHLALLARRYADRLGTGCLEGRRRADRVPQAGLARRQREHNLRDTFEVGRMPPSVVLVDDVLTTGSTLAALAQACRAAGAREVHGVVIARTPAPYELRPD
jgi:predicted amidophosphoribosyltransferase